MQMYQFSPHVIEKQVGAPCHVAQANLNMFSSVQTALNIYSCTSMIWEQIPRISKQHHGQVLFIYHVWTAFFSELFIELSSNSLLQVKLPPLLDLLMRKLIVKKKRNPIALAVKQPLGSFWEFSNILLYFFIFLHLIVAQRRNNQAKLSCFCLQVIAD